MKKLFLTLLLSLSLTTCFGADLSISPAKDVEQVSGKQIFKASIGGDSDNVVIGDEKNPASFKNEITFKKWKNAQSGQFENSLSIIPPQDLIPSASVVLASSQLVTKNNTVGFYFNKSPDNDTDFKFGLILYEKPTTNTWSFQLEGWEEFDFFYQGIWKDGLGNEISEKYENGKIAHSRKPEVNGSYAVYHKTKANYEIGKINYKTGKLGNLYRPKFIDAEGKSEWAELEIKDGIYKVTVPQKFLDTAVYPVKVNDTFGQLDEGANVRYDWFNKWWWWACKAASTPASNGTLTSITLYCAKASGEPELEVAIYSDDSGSPGNLLASDLTGTIVTNTGILPISTDIDYASITSGTQYWLAFFNGDDTTAGNFTYDEVVGTDLWGTETVPSPPDPYDGSGQQAWKVAIYATYTAGGGEPTTDQKSFQFFSAGDELPHWDTATITRGATTTPYTHTDATTNVSFSHTVDADTTLMLVFIGTTADYDVTSAVNWNTNEALTEITSVETSSGTGDVNIWCFGIVSPTATTANITFDMTASSDCAFAYAVNYKGTISSSVAAATNVVDTEDNSNNAATTVSLSGTGTTGSTLVASGVFYGGDGDPAAASGYDTVGSNASGTSTSTDVSYYVGEDIGGGSATSTAVIDWVSTASDECVGVLIEVLPLLTADGRTPLDVVGTDPTLNVDTDYGCSIRLENADATSSDHYKLQYKLNAGSWTDITDASSVVKSTLTGDFTNLDDVPEYITGSGTYDTNNNSALESVGDFTLGAALAASHSTECHLNFQIPNADVVNGDSIQVRIIYNAGGALEVYTLTPTITVSEGGEPPAYTGAVIIMVN